MILPWNYNFYIGVLSYINIRYKITGISLRYEEEEK